MNKGSLNFASVVEGHRRKANASKFLEKLSQLKIPWFFDRQEDGHLIIRGKSKEMEFLSRSLTTLAGQLLHTHPPGMLRFLMIDPVGLGKNFAAFHALADYDDKLISNKVWSDSRHISDQLKSVCDHIEAVVQKYLRADYQTIDDYNLDAGEIAEPYRYVFINGFPENFNSDSCLALERIIANGAKCGVHVIMLWEYEKALPHGINEEQILQSVNALNSLPTGDLKYQEKLDNNKVFKFDVDEIPHPDVLKKIVNRFGKGAAEGTRVIVPFDQLMERVFSAAPGATQDVREVWSTQNDDRLIAPLGPTGARKIQNLIFGENGTTAHHALLVGKTGSGKSNLLHVLIVSMIQIYDPDQLELYLIDFKKGVEFKDYADHRLPHARVIAIESETEFGISVLRGLDAELTRRGEVFRENTVAELSAYRSKTGKKLPRTVTIIDEFHELLVDEGPVSREALQILERIVRQGRSFGMHLILASQSIAGVRLPKSLLDQIGVRIAMQCSESDSRQVLAEDNGAARHLDRAGEAIYNDKNGLVEGNNIFQVALLKQEERIDHLRTIRRDVETRYPASTRATDGPYIFEGSQPAHIEDCRKFNEYRATQIGSTNLSEIDAWVGEPIAMLPAHSILFKRQSGANLLVLDRDEKLSFGVVYGALLSLTIQSDPGSVEFHFVDFSLANSEWANHPEAIRDNFPHTCKIYGRRDLAELISEFGLNVGTTNFEKAIKVKRKFLIIFGLHRARELRRESGSFSFGKDANGPSIHENLATILREGPEMGVHTMIWCDTLQNLSRILDNTSVNEIGHRIVGALPTNDSVKLLDDPIASKLTRENRMICYDDEKVGVFNPIRPYLPPSMNWVIELGAELSAKFNK